MYSLFKLLFRSNYWKMLLRRATWREAGRSFRRAHKDKRARKHIFAFGLALLVPLLCALYLLWLAGTGAILLVPFVLPVLWWRSKRAEQDDVPLTIAPKGSNAREELSEGRLREVRQHLARVCLFYAVMCDRAGSESYLKQKVLPPGVEVASRRNHLELLGAHGIWDSMGGLDRQAMMIADGHWEWEQINRVAEKLELLRLLRWMLRLDFYLPVVGQQLRLEFCWAHELALDPKKMLEGTQLISWSEVLTARDAAQQYYLRCAAEGISRGLYEAKMEEFAEWANAFRGELAGNQDEDLVLGSQLVSEADDQTLRTAIAIAGSRHPFMDWALEMLGGQELPATMPYIFADVDTY